MEIRFFPDTSRLTWPMRFLHGFLSLAGFLGMILVFLVLVLDIKSGSGRRPPNANVLVLCVMLASAHVVWELGRSGPLSKARWIAFGLCIAELMWLMVKHISDPTGRVVFMWMLGICALMILVARLMVRNLSNAAVTQSDSNLQQ